MEKRLLRFKYCDPKFYPYLEKVLNRLPVEIKGDILNDKNLQILSHKDFSKLNGAHFTFDEPVTNVVYLNTSILKEPEHEIIYVIVHELAHHVAGKGKTGLPEKEAEELVLKWDFVMESEKASYDRPIVESAFYDTGYKWATIQEDQDLIDKFGEYFEDWDNDNLSQEQLEYLYETYPTAILNEMGQLGGGEDINGNSEKEIFADVFSIYKSVIWGVMGRVKEILSKRRSYYGDFDTSTADLLTTLEEIKIKFDKLSSLPKSVDFIEKMAAYEILDCGGNVAEFLEEYKEN
jgi:hypothetical protein